MSAISIGLSGVPTPPIGGQPIPPSGDQLDTKHSAAANPSTGTALPFQASAGAGVAAGAGAAAAKAAAAGAPVLGAVATAVAAAASQPQSLGNHAVANLPSVGQAAVQLQQQAVGAAQARLSKAGAAAHGIQLQQVGKPEDHGSANELEKAHAKNLNNPVIRFFKDNWKTILIVALAVAMIALAFFCPPIAVAAALAAAASGSPAIITLNIGLVLAGGLLLGFGLGGLEKSSEEKAAASRLEKMNEALKSSTKCENYNERINKRIKFYKPQNATMPKKSKEDWIQWKLQPKVYDTLEEGVYQTKFDEYSNCKKRLSALSTEKRDKDEREHIQSRLHDLDKEMEDLIRELDADEKIQFTEMGMVPKQINEIIDNPTDPDNAALIEAAKKELEKEGKIQPGKTTQAVQDRLIKERIEMELGGDYHQKRTGRQTPPPPSAPPPPTPSAPPP